MLRKTYNRAPEDGWAISVSTCLVLVAFCHIWVHFVDFFWICIERGFFWISIMTINIKMQQMFHWLRNGKQINIWNLTKVNGIHERKPLEIYETKRNFPFYETKRNGTKRNFAVFVVSRNKRNFAKQTFCFALFRVSRNKKKDAKWKPYDWR
jgi:hypothetical protein